MSHELDQQISDARQDLERRTAIEERLAEAREEKTTAEYRIDALASYVEQAEAALQELESVNIGSLISTLTGSRDRKVAARQVELQDVQDKHNEATEQLSTLTSEIASLEAELSAIPDVAAQYEALCQQKRDAVLAAGGETAEQFKTLTEASERLTAIERQCQSIVESGEQVVERIHSMTGAVGRARNKMGATSALGAIGQVAFDTIAARSANPAVKRVSEGLTQFYERLKALDCSEGTDLDLEIVRQTSEVEQLCVQMSATSGVDLAWGSGTESALQEQIFAVLGLVQGKHDRVEQSLAENRSQQDALMASS